MTNTTTDKVSPQDTLAAAENVYKSTQAAADAALAAASRRELDDAEAAAVQAIADAVTGEGDRATADAARARVEQLRRDHEWAQVELQAAEAATSRAYDQIVRARRGVVAEEIVAAHRIHNDKSTRLNKLLTQLPELLSELIPLIAERDALHRRLGQELHAMPYDEWPNLPAGEPITAPDPSASPNVMVEVPRGAIADAIAAGVAQARVAAAERQRAAAYGEA
jgi:hypothetical protein